MLFFFSESVHVLMLCYVFPIVFYCVCDCSVLLPSELGMCICLRSFQGKIQEYPLTRITLVRRPLSVFRLASFGATTSLPRPDSQLETTGS